MRRHAFTLIELLIVVAIIAILAAIAVPNFLEAQTRAKVSRSKADMRSMATAIETYRIDFNQYPYAAQWFCAPDTISPPTFNLRLRSLTTPTSYITSLPLDVFTTQEGTFPFTPGQDPTYEYEDALTAVSGSGAPCDFGLFNSLEAYSEYFTGRQGAEVSWNLLSAGPDRNNDFQQQGAGISSPADIRGLNNHYDPTNGTISIGDVIRTNIEQID